MSIKQRGFRRSSVELAILSIALASSAFADGKRPFETRDSIEMSYFGTLGASMPPDVDDDGIMSPDGRWVVKITHRGVLPAGVTEGTLWLFDALEMQRSVNHQNITVPAAVAIVKVSALVNGMDFIADRGNTIYQVKWGGTSRTLSFLGRDGQENRQLFEVDLATRRVTALTPPTQDVVNYVATRKGFVYFVAPDRQEAQEWWSTGPAIPDIEIGTGSSFRHLLYPRYVGDACCVPVTLEVWKVLAGSALPLVDSRTMRPAQVITRYGAEVIGLAPDENRLATIAYDEVPQRGRDPPLHYRLIDLKTGVSETLLDTPVGSNDNGFGGRYRAVWSPDASAIAVSVLHEPATGDGNGSRICEVGILSVSTRHFNCVMRPRNPSPGVLYSMYWTPDSERLGLRYRQHGNGLYEDQFVERKHYAQQEMLVDWFDFWLNGHEDTDVTKSAQYVRWRKLKESRAVAEKAAT
jgi:hypothetical protein